MVILLYQELHTLPTKHFQNEQSEKQIFLEYTLNTNTMVASL